MRSGAPPRVVLCWPNFEPDNAAGVRARAFARDLRVLGWDVHVITMPDAKATQDPPAPVETMPLFLHPKHWPALLGGTARLAARLKALAPDVVLVSSPPSSFAWQAGRAATRAGIPYVADVRDLFTAGMRAVFGDRARYVVAERMEGAYYRGAAAVTPVTGLAREHLLRDFPRVEPSRVRVVLNGADPLVRPSPLPERDLDVLFVGEMFDAGRRGDDLFDAYARVLKERPATRFTFLGWRPNPYADDLLAGAPAPLRRALDLHGRVPREKVADFTLRAKVGVVPINTADVFRTMLPAKAYEYVEAGLPVAALGHAGDSETRRFVEGNDVGLFASTPEDLAAVILRLLGDARERARLSDNARRLAPTFHRRRAAEQMHRVLSEVAAR